MSVAGPPETPSKAGVAIVDVVTALYATVAVLAALLGFVQQDASRHGAVAVSV